MLTSEDAHRLQLFKQGLLAFTPVSHLAAYGSRARGEAGADADLDLFVEVPSLTPTLRRQIRELAWEISLAEGCVISTFVTTPQALATGPLGALPLLRAIEKEGVFA